MGRDHRCGGPSAQHVAGRTGSRATLRHRWICKPPGCFMVGRADRWRSGRCCGRRSRRRQQGGQGDIHQPDAADGHAGDRGSGPDTLFAFTDRRLLDDCRPACRHWFVWCTGNFRAAANCGDWSAHGPGRRAVTHLPFDGREGTLPERAWHRDWSTRVLASMLVEVKPTDPLTFAGVAVLFLVIAVMASWLPALRAAGLDPTTALRNE